MEEKKDNTEYNGEPFPDEARQYLDSLYSALPSKPKTAREKVDYLSSKHNIPVPRLDADIRGTLKSLEFFHLTEMKIL